MYPYRVFLSYYHGDRGKARKLRDFLADMGLSVMWDKDITVSTRFNERIRNDISRAHLFVTLITEEALLRPWVHHETGYALGIGIAVFTVAVGAVSPGMTGDQQAAVVSAKLTARELASYLDERTITTKVEEAGDTAGAVFKPVAYTGGRAREFEACMKRLVRDMQAYGVIRQDGAMTSFNIPRSAVTSKEWDDREGVEKRTREVREALRAERLAFEEHARHAGCKLIIDPSVTFEKEGRHGARVRRTRLMTLRQFLVSAAPYDEKVKIVSRPREDTPNVTIVGDWFMGLAQVGAKRPRGYPQTDFTWHAPTVLNYLRQFDEKFEELYAATDLGGKSSRKWAIDLLDKTISEIPGRPAPRPTTRNAARKKAGR